MTRFQLSVHADQLPRSLFRTPHPYAVVTVFKGTMSGTGTEAGRTETIVKTTSPDWTKTLFIETDASVNLPVKIAVWDDRGANKKDVLIGEVEFEATVIYQSPGRMQSQKLRVNGGGTVSAGMEESVKGDDVGRFAFQLRGLDIKNVEAGFLGLGRTDPFYEIAKKNADHAAGLVRWNVIYRSEHCDNHLNPFWKEPDPISLEELCYCDVNAPLLISVYDWNANGKHTEVGRFETTVKTLMGQVGVKGNADQEKAFPLYSQKGTTKGLICVLKAEIV